MIRHFIKFDSELRQALHSSLILTPNERLRRQLRQAAQIQFEIEGTQAGMAPAIQTLAQYFSASYRDARFNNPQLPGIASTESLHAGAFDTAPRGLSGLTPTFLDACTSSWRFTIEPTSKTRLTTESGRIGAAWEQRLDQWLQEHQLVPAEQLTSRYADILIAALCAENRGICLLAVEQLPAAQAALFEQVRQRGQSVSSIDLDLTPQSSVIQVSTRDPAEELNLASQWCRSVREQQPDAHIGVVFPDLSGRQSTIRRQFAANLAPGINSRNTGQFDIAGGESLADEPAWRIARCFLRWCYGPLPAEDIEDLIQSDMLPQLAGLTIEALLPSTFDLPLYSWRQQSNPVLRAISEQIRRQPSGASLDVWIRQFQQLLFEIGWPGNGLGSVQFQAVATLNEILQRLRSSGSRQSIDATTALQLLDQRLKRHLFAPEQPSAPILILGPLETTGLHFSHLWIAGLTENAWPAAVPNNPFLPVAVCREYNLPRSDPLAELRFARQRLQHWLAAADNVVLSFPLSQEDMPLHPSPLLPPAAKVTPEMLVKAWNPRSNPLFKSQDWKLEAVSADQATHLPQGQLTGGSALLQDLANCTFRAWARHRLGLKTANLPHSFPDARDRGILVHRALQQAAHLAPDNNAASALSRDHLIDLAERTVTENFGRFPEPYREQEINRLTELLVRWLDFEQQRSPFQLVDVEFNRTLEVGGYRLQLRVDRADRIGDELVIIDFKTGSVKPSVLLDPDLPEPQLPAYACSDAEIAGIFFVSVGAEAIKWQGLAEQHMTIPEARLQPLIDTTFEERRIQWMQRVTDLITSYTLGNAAVAPRNAEVCRHCDLQPFCRVRHGNRST